MIDKAYEDGSVRTVCVWKVYKSSKKWVWFGVDKLCSGEP